MPTIVDPSEVVGMVERGDVRVERMVMVEEHPEYPGELVFQTMPDYEITFYTRYRDWVSRYLVLNELFNWAAFDDRLEQDGWQVLYAPSAAAILANWHRWTAPFEVEGYSLYPFQQFSMQRAFERDFWFFNWATGAGKSLCAAVGSKELFARDMIDQVIVCCPTAAKENMRRWFEAAGLDAVVNDGTKVKRSKGYIKRHQVYVMNYEKLRFDYALLLPLVKGRRVLFIFDECQHIVNADPEKHNLARLHFRMLLSVAHLDSKVWPMSASVVNGNPLRFRDVFDLGQRACPLGGHDEFVARYALKIKEIDLTHDSGRSFTLIDYDWNLPKLQEVRHRVGSDTQAVRKEDPGVADLFKDLQTIKEPIQMGKLEREMSDAVIELAAEAREKGHTMAPYYYTLRYLANTPLALWVTEYDFARELAKDFTGTKERLVAAKTDVLNDKLQSIREAGDQALVFTHWTTLTLHLIAEHIEVPYVLHYGTGQSAKDSQAAQDTFKADPDITCFFTSDAGKEALNFQNARYVIQYEPTYSFDDTYQRASRIHRSDSTLDGLTNYVLVTDDSVEERVWQLNYSRRVLTEVTQGTRESLSFGDGYVDHERAQRSEAANMTWAIFGEE